MKHKLHGFSKQEVIFFSESLEEERSVCTSAEFTGDFEIPIELTKPVRFVQLNIRRCHSDGCDVRIRGLIIEGHSTDSQSSAASSVVEELAMGKRKLGHST